MGIVEKKYIKVYCKKTNCYGLITAEPNNGSLKIVNFYEIDDDTAKNVTTSYEGTLPPVSAHLKACSTCGARNPKCCDKTRQCKVPKGELWYQCLYCSGLEISQASTAGGSADIYFLLDESGSMSADDRKEGANAVRKMVQALQGAGNTYSFVAWGSNAGYVFKKETNVAKISSALSSYENHTTGYGGSTAAHIAFNCIKPDVLASTKPVRIIFVTDGYLDNESLALQARNELLARKDVEIVAIGVTGASQSTLSKLGTVPAFSKVVGGSSALTSTFEQIAEILKKKGNNF